jgi:hypothetical protein
VRYACESVFLDPDDLTCDCKVDGTELTEAQLVNLLESSSDLLAQVTGLPVGRCMTIYRPCRSYCHGLGCSCGCNLDGILLPGLDPEVVEVRIDGALVPEAEWAMMRSPSGDRYLERFFSTGYSRPWPSSQPVGLPHTATGTFSVTVEAGTDILDPVTQMAVNDIVCEILTKMDGDRETEDGAVSAVAYGVSLDYRRFGDPTDQETMALAGLSWIRRFVLAHGGANYSVIDSNDLHNGWELRVNTRDEAIPTPVP